MSDDIIARLRCSYADPPCESCTFCAARAEIERLCAELSAFVVRPDEILVINCPPGMEPSELIAATKESPLAGRVIVLRNLEARRG